ncbi:glycoside hydrolase family 28 protein [Candidatus Kaistella beijingensis]|uniref:glycoside hydrolase family 28 protein n=1 Tax=Candidatus Kaistella beijingensis TaxID=2820270 RepID=UPI001CC6C39C|nr:glycoside hydrolase family 28 protein [Candidatus Kaistella beijingensis]UBB88669.1 glycoside hydrolase family 28 protein [Candidatus Kaistella beijingensis]
MNYIISKKIIITLCFSFCLQSINSQTTDWQSYVDKAPFKVKLPTNANINSGKKIISVKDFGAIPDAKTLTTEAFQKAIDQSSKDGNTIIKVPAGNWLLSPIELKSNITIHLEKGAVMQFTKDRTKFPMLAKNSKGTEYFVMSPIYARNVANVIITGEGTIDGGGDSWRPVKKGKVTADFWENLIRTGVLSDDKKVWWPSSDAMNGDNILNSLKKKTDLTEKDFLPARDFLRPYLMNLINCKNLQIHGITIQNSPKLTVYVSQSDGVILNNLKVLNPKWGQNTDGIDISGSKNVLVYNCTVDVGDDGICMKSSSKKDDTSTQLENIIIAKNTVFNAHGGFSIGSNTDGGMNNIFVTDCNFIGTDIGVRVKSNEGIGGNVSNIYIENIVMKNIVEEAINMSSVYENRQVGKTPDNNVKGEKIPEYFNFYFKNITCEGAETAVNLNGLENSPIHDLYFENVMIKANNGFVAENVEHVFMKNTKILCEGNPFKLKNATNVLLDGKVVR